MRDEFALCSPQRLVAFPKALTAEANIAWGFDPKWSA